MEKIKEVNYINYKGACDSINETVKAYLDEALNTANENGHLLSICGVKINIKCCSTNSRNAEQYRFDIDIAID